MPSGIVLDLRNLGDLYDDSRNHYTITNHNAIPVRGMHGHGMSFNGIDAYLDCGNHSSLNITDAITIETLFYVNSGALIGYVLSKNSVGTTDNQYGFFWDNVSAKVRGYLEGALVGSSSDNSVLEAQWNSISMVYNQIDVRYYINGVLSGTPFAKTDSITPNNFTVNIGRRKPNTGYFNVIISSVTIYNYALSADEIKLQYRQQSPYYQEEAPTICL